MKLIKAIAYLLIASTLAALFASCAPGTLAPLETETTGNATAAPTNDEPEPTKTPPTTKRIYTMTKHTFSELADSIRLRGERTHLVAEGLVAEWSCTGFDVSLETEGTDFNVEYQSSYDSYWRVYVDGEAQPARIFCAASSEGKTMTFIKDLEAGVHTVRIVKDSQVSTTPGSNCTLTAVSFDGTVLPVDQAKKALYLEFIGDSLSSGSGALGNSASSPTYNSEISGTSAYPYLIAEALDADYSVVSRGSIGITAKAGEYTMLDLYPKLDGYRDDTPYRPTRTPDIIVINLSTNDAEDTAGQFIIDGQKFIRDIRSTYGKNVKIVWVYGMFSKTHLVTSIQQMAELAGGEANGIYTFQMIHGRNGSGSKDNNRHPSAEDHAKNAEHLLPYLKQLMGLRSE